MLTLEHREVHKRNKKIPNNLGYSSAVDMWSVGTIATVLLTGTLIFTENQYGTQDEWESRLQAAAQCDLSVIDDEDSEWALVGRRGKAFVKALLILDERKRLTAKEALQHPFISCHLYAKELDKVYKNAVRDWKPRTRVRNIVQRIDTSDILMPSPVESSQELPVQEVESAYFQDDQRDPSHDLESGSQRHKAQHTTPPSRRHEFASEPTQLSQEQYQREASAWCNEQGEQLRQVFDDGILRPADPTQASYLQSISQLGAQGSAELGTWPKTQFTLVQSMAEGSGGAAVESQEL